MADLKVGWLMVVSAELEFVELVLFQKLSI